VAQPQVQRKWSPSRRGLVANKVSPLALFVFLGCLTSPSGVSADVRRTPIVGNLELHDPPNFETPIRATFSVEAERDFPTVDIEFLVPDGVMWVEGDTILHISLKRGDKKEFPATVHIISDYWLGRFEGVFIWAMARATAADGRQWSFISAAKTNGFIERTTMCTGGLQAFRARNPIGQPSKQEIEEVRDGVGLPDNPDYTIVAAHLWYSELRWFWQRGYSKEESFEVMQDLARYLARKRRTTRPEAVAAIVEEGIFGKLMERRTRIRALWTPGKIVGVAAVGVFLPMLLFKVLRRSGFKTWA
jgi:hypothetical protein